MREVMAEKAGIPEEELPDNNMYVLTNDEGFEGASALLHPELFEEAAEEVEDNVIIIPSSIHELLCVPMSVISVKDAAEMIVEVNESQVAPEDVLSTHPYIYWRETKNITF